jgi:hypothetical protein
MTLLSDQAIELRFTGDKLRRCSSHQQLSGGERADKTWMAGWWVGLDSRSWRHIKRPRQEGQWRLHFSIGVGSLVLKWTKGLDVRAHASGDAACHPYQRLRGNAGPLHNQTLRSSLADS